MTDPVFGVSWPEIMAFERVWPYLAGALAIGFAAGAAPMGLIVARVFGLGDPRKIGSGNVGATNMMRAGGWKVGVIVLALDAAKAWAPAMLFWSQLGPLAAGCAGLGAFLGHCFSPWLGFKGGKGVASGFGALLAWRWEIGALAALVWVATALAFRISSVASLATAIAALALVAHFEAWDYAPFALVMAAVLVWRHSANIGRLIRGEEPRIGGAKKT